MNAYETLVLVTTTVTDDEISSIQKQFQELAEKAQGRFVVFDRWGKYRLAYPIKHHDYGIYVLVRYEVPSQELSVLLKEIDLFFKIKCSDIVIRHTTMKLPGSAQAPYSKPEPIASAGTSNFDSFIKNHNMEGLLQTDIGESSAHADDEGAEETDQEDESSQYDDEQEELEEE